MSAAEPPAGHPDAHIVTPRSASGVMSSAANTPDLMAATSDPPENPPESAATSDATAAAPRRQHLRVVAAVFVGGMAGTALRLALNSVVSDALWVTEYVPVPVATVAANFAGTAVLSFLVGAGWRGSRSWCWPAVTTGFLGSFTTFSALIAATLPLTSASMLSIPAAWGWATVLLVGSVAAGLVVAAAGIRLGRYAAGRWDTADTPHTPGSANSPTPDGPPGSANTTTTTGGP